MSKEKINRNIRTPRGGYRRTIESGRNPEFVEVQTADIGKNPFDLSHNFAFTGNIGELMPTLCKPVYPNETWMIGADMLVRLQALVAPAMHRLDVRTDFFFCPWRLVWANWEKFARNDSSGSGLPAHPYVELNSATNADVKKMCDYLGIATTGTAGFTEQVNPLYAAAYNLIYNEWYRSQQLSTKRDFLCTDGNNTSNITDLFKLANVTFEHDYFTACLPDPQLGATPVDIPLGDITLKTNWGSLQPPAPSFRDTSNVLANTGELDWNQVTGEIQSTVGVISQAPIAYDPEGSLEVQATTIRDLRRAEVIQEWLEKSARGGDRYTEIIKMHFNQNSSDARLQRPEFITGVTSPVYISEVLNTAGEVGGLAQGNMAGHGLASAEGNFGKYHSEEHGCILGITYIIPKPAYFQGIPREFNVPQSAIEGLMWPSFAHIGEQDVLVRELKAYEASSTDVFGYIPRFSELKYAQNRIGGLFKNTMKFWTFARELSANPTLSEAFIQVDPDDFTEPFAVSDDDLILFNIYFKIRAIRALPTFSTPHL